MPVQLGTFASGRPIVRFFLFWQTNYFVRDGPTVPSLETHRPVRRPSIGAGCEAQKGFAASTRCDQNNRQGFTRRVCASGKLDPTGKEREGFYCRPCWRK